MPSRNKRDLSLRRKKALAICKLREMCALSKSHQFTIAEASLILESLEQNILKDQDKIYTARVSGAIQIARHAQNAADDYVIGCDRAVRNAASRAAFVSNQAIPKGPQNELSDSIAPCTKKYPAFVPTQDASARAGSSNGARVSNGERIAIKASSTIIDRKNPPAEREAHAGRAARVARAAHAARVARVARTLCNARSRLTHAVRLANHARNMTRRTFMALSTSSGVSNAPLISIASLLDDPLPLVTSPTLSFGESNVTNKSNASEDIKQGVWSPEPSPVTSL